jgi:hypothetical protein
MAGWFPGWQLVLTYAFVIAVAALFYFAPSSACRSSKRLTGKPRRYPQRRDHQGLARRPGVLQTSRL